MSHVTLIPRRDFFSQLLVIGLLRKIIKINFTLVMTRVNDY